MEFSVGVVITVMSIFFGLMVYSTNMSSIMLSEEREKYGRATTKYYEMCEKHNTKEVCFYKWSEQ